MRLALEGGLYQFNLESVAEAEMLSAVATAMGRDRAGRLPRQSRRRRRRPRQDHDRRGREQVRHRDRRGARRLCARRGAARPQGAGRRRPYRQPADQPRPARARVRPRRRADRRAARCRARHPRRRSRRRARRPLRSRARRRRRAPPIMARWSAGSPAGWDVAAGVRAGAADRRQCRRAAVARDPREAGRDRPVRDRRRGDERSDAAGALRRLAPHRGGRARRGGSALPTSSGRSARPATPSRPAREMDEVEAGDLVVFRTAGAYAAAMSSTYNSRPLTPEVLVDGDRWAVVRPRVDDRGADRRRPAARLARRLRATPPAAKAAPQWPAS